MHKCVWYHAVPKAFQHEIHNIVPFVRGRSVDHVRLRLINKLRSQPEVRLRFRDVLIERNVPICEHTKQIRVTDRVT